MRLFSWADETRLKIEDHRPNLEQAEVDRMFAICRAKMGDAAVSSAYEQGRKMTVDEAAAYTRGKEE